jgi:membrane-associated protein
VDESLPLGRAPDSPMQTLIDLFHRVYDVQWLVTAFGLFGLIFIIFAETGLLVGFFLPGDSLLVTAGIFCTSANPTGHPILDVWACLILVSLSAVIGDTTGYWIGAKSGPKLFTREQSLLFNRKHLLRTKEFYERHGGKTIIIARFMPFVRTFAPVVAGIGQMRYRRFLAYNVFGGVGWVFSMILLGYTLASHWPGVTKQIDKLIIIIIFLSLLPAMIGWLRSRLSSRKRA